MGVDNSGVLIIGYDLSKQKDGFLNAINYRSWLDGRSDEWGNLYDIVPDNLRTSFQIGDPPSMSDQFDGVLGLYVISPSYRMKKLDTDFCKHIEQAFSWLTELFGVEPTIWIGNAQW